MVDADSSGRDRARQSYQAADSFKGSNVIKQVVPRTVDQTAKDKTEWERVSFEGAFEGTTIPTLNRQQKCKNCSKLYLKSPVSTHMRTARSRADSEESGSSTRDSVGLGSFDDLGSIDTDGPSGWSEGTSWNDTQELQSAYSGDVLSEGEEIGGVKDSIHSQSRIANSCAALKLCCCGEQGCKCCCIQAQYNAPGPQELRFFPLPIDFRTFVDCEGANEVIPDFCGPECRWSHRLREEFELGKQFTAKMKQHKEKKLNFVSTNQN